jgi:hypothetical protein
MTDLLLHLKIHIKKLERNNLFRIKSVEKAADAMPGQDLYTLRRLTAGDIKSGF